LPAADADDPRLNIHYSRASDLGAPDLLVTSPAVPITMYRDLFGNWQPDRRARGASS
jgi:hypothetical protein